MVNSLSTLIPEEQAFLVSCKLWKGEKRKSYIWKKGKFKEKEMLSLANEQEIKLSLGLEVFTKAAVLFLFHTTGSVKSYRRQF